MARTISTYSIAACDLEAEQWGVAVQSKFLAVGSVVPWAEPHVGAIATQAYANPTYGLGVPRLGGASDRDRLRRAGQHSRRGGDGRRTRDEVRGDRGPEAGAPADRLPRRGAGGGRRPPRPAVGGA